MSDLLYAFILDDRCGNQSKKVTIYLVIIDSFGKVLRINNLSRFNVPKPVIGIEGTKIFENYIIQHDAFSQSILEAFTKGLINISEFI